jgi:hypothetical protein
MKGLVVLAIAGVLAGCGEKAEAPKSAASADNASHCVNALHQLGTADGIDPDRSALALPWKITAEKSPENRLRITCEIANGGYRGWVTADVICDDTERGQCVKVVGVKSSDELAIPVRSDR